MADKIAGREVNPNPNSGIPIRFKDMSDGTWAEVVSTSGGGGGGGVVSFAAATNYTSAALEASHIVKNAAGTLWGLTVFNSSASAQFYQLFDSATLPANATVPIEPMKIAAGGSGAWDFGERGRAFANGIVVSNSSTGATKTIGAADSLFDAQYT